VTSRQPEGSPGPDNTASPTAPEAAPAGVATGVGSMPGTDIDEACRIVVGEIPDLPALPELPARGAAAQMIGRTAGLLTDLHVDLQPSGWRITSAPGMDERRAVAVLRSDLDTFTERAQGCDTAVKVAVVGPLTLAASLEKGSGGALVADHGARHELAESLAEGLRDLVADLRARFPAARCLLQLDEPMLPEVLAGRVSTPSGFGSYRSVTTDEARTLLRLVTDQVRDAEAIPMLHSCADSVDVALVAGAGIAALSIDLDAVSGADGEPRRGLNIDPWCEAVENGLVIYAGAVAATDPSGPADPVAVTRRVLAFGHWLGLDEEGAARSLGVTPACGLAGASPDWARRALEICRTVAGNLSGSDVGGDRQDGHHDR
jgi:methionine synthase II (cobalamin-independent)